MFVAATTSANHPANVIGKNSSGDSTWPPDSSLQMAQHTLVTSPELAVPFIVLTMICNVFVIMAYYREARLRVTFNVFVLELACLDCVMGTLLLYELLQELGLLKYFAYIESFCKFFAIAFNTVQLCQLFSLWEMMGARTRSIRRGLAYWPSSRRIRVMNAHRIKMAIVLVFSGSSGYIMVDSLPSNNTEDPTKPTVSDPCLFPSRTLYVKYSAFIVCPVVLYLVMRLLCMSSYFLECPGGEDQDIAENGMSSINASDTSLAVLSRQSSQNLIPRSPLQSSLHAPDVEIMQPQIHKLGVSNAAVIQVVVSPSASKRDIGTMGTTPKPSHGMQVSVIISPRLDNHMHPLLYSQRDSSSTIQETNFVPGAVSVLYDSKTTRKNIDTEAAPYPSRKFVQTSNTLVPFSEVESNESVMIISDNPVSETSKSLISSDIGAPFSQSDDELSIDLGLPVKRMVKPKSDSLNTLRSYRSISPDSPNLERPFSNIELVSLDDYVITDNSSMKHSHSEHVETNMDTKAFTAGQILNEQNGHESQVVVQEPNIDISLLGEVQRGVTDGDKEQESTLDEDVFMKVPESLHGFSDIVSLISDEGSQTNANIDAFSKTSDLVTKESTESTVDERSTHPSGLRSTPSAHSHRWNVTRKHIKARMQPQTAVWPADVQTKVSSNDTDGNKLQIETVGVSGNLVVGDKNKPLMSMDARQDDDSDAQSTICTNVKPSVTQENVDDELKCEMADESTVVSVDDLQSSISRVPIDSDLDTGSSPNLASANKQTVYEPLPDDSENAEPENSQNNNNNSAQSDGVKSSTLSKHAFSRWLPKQTIGSHPSLQRKGQRRKSKLARCEHYSVSDVQIPCQWEPVNRYKHSGGCSSLNSRDDGTFSEALNMTRTTESHEDKLKKANKQQFHSMTDGVEFLGMTIEDRQCGSEGTPSGLFRNNVKQAVGNWLDFYGINCKTPVNYALSYHSNNSELVKNCSVDPDTTLCIHTPNSTKVNCATLRLGRDESTLPVEKSSLRETHSEAEIPINNELLTCPSVLTNNQMISLKRDSLSAEISPVDDLSCEKLEADFDISRKREICHNVCNQTCPRREKRVRFSESSYKEEFDPRCVVCGKFRECKRKSRRRCSKQSYDLSLVQDNEHSMSEGCGDMDCSSTYIKPENDLAENELLTADRTSDLCKTTCSTLPSSPLLNDLSHENRPEDLLQTSPTHNEPHIVCHYKTEETMTTALGIHHPKHCTWSSETSGQTFHNDVDTIGIFHTPESFRSISLPRKAFILEIGLYEEFSQGTLPLSGFENPERDCEDSFCILEHCTCSKPTTQGTQVDNDLARGRCHGEHRCHTCDNAGYDQMSPVMDNVNNSKSRSRKSAKCPNSLPKPSSDNSTRSSSRDFDSRREQKRSEGSPVDRKTPTYNSKDSLASSQKNSSKVSFASSHKNSSHSSLDNSQRSDAQSRTCCLLSIQGFDELKVRNPPLGLFLSMTFIAILQVLCWLPITLLYLTYELTDFPAQPNTAELWLLWFSRTRLFLQPFVYVYYSKVYRRRLVNLVTCQW